MRKRGLYFAVMCIVVLAVSASVPSPHAKANGGHIVGSWIITPTINTPPGAPPFVLTELGSFNPGGTFIDTASIGFSSQNPALAQTPFAVNFSDAFGVWQQLGDESNQFAVTFKRLLFAGADTPTAVYGSFFPGQNVGMATVEAVATLQTDAGGDTLTGPFTFQLTNLSGTVVLSGSGTFSANRLVIQPLADHVLRQAAR